MCVGSWVYDGPSRFLNFRYINLPPLSAPYCPPFAQSFLWPFPHFSTFWLSAIEIYAAIRPRLCFAPPPIPTHLSLALSLAFANCLRSECAGYFAENTTQRVAYTSDNWPVSMDCIVLYCTVLTTVHCKNYPALHCRFVQILCLLDLFRAAPSFDLNFCRPLTLQNCFPLLIWQLATPRYYTGTVRLLYCTGLYLTLLYTTVSLGRLLFCSMQCLDVNCIIDMPLKAIALLF